MSHNLKIICDKPSFAQATPGDSAAVAAAATAPPALPGTTAAANPASNASSNYVSPAGQIAAPVAMMQPGTVQNAPAGYYAVAMPQNMQPQTGGVTGTAPGALANGVPAAAASYVPATANVPMVYYAIVAAPGGQAGAAAAPAPGFLPVVPAGYSPAPAAPPTPVSQISLPAAPAAPLQSGQSAPSQSSQPAPSQGSQSSPLQSQVTSPQGDQPAIKQGGSASIAPEQPSPKELPNMQLVRAYPPGSSEDTDPQAADTLASAAAATHVAAASTTQRQTPTAPVVPVLYHAGGAAPVQGPIGAVAAVNTNAGVVPPAAQP